MERKRTRTYEASSTVVGKEELRVQSRSSLPRRPLEVCQGPSPHHDRPSVAHDPEPLFTTTWVFLCGSVLILLANLWTPLALVVLWIAARLQRYWFRVNDEPSARRKLIKEFLKTDQATRPLRDLPEDVHVEESYWVNRRGMSLMASVMTPTNRSVDAVVCFCHGYADFPTLTKRKELSRMTRAGIAVVMIEYEGHGRSDGILGLITDWDKLIDDTTAFFQQTVQRRFENVDNCFLMGESMGGAVAYCTYKRNPKLFRGVVFCCPMCKIGEDCLPSQWVIDVFRRLAGPKGTASTLGYLPIAPSQGVNIDWSIRPHKQALLSSFPLEYGRKPRLATARELLDVTIHISNDLQNFDAPFLVQHGAMDRVTDPNLSRQLYNESKSTDKSIRVYEGMLHSLLCGEFDENIDMVIQDSIRWVLERSKPKNQ